MSTARIDTIGNEVMYTAPTVKLNMRRMKNKMFKEIGYQAGNGISSNSSCNFTVPLLNASILSIN